MLYCKSITQWIHKKLMKGGEMMKVMKITDMQALGYFSLQVRKEKQKTLQDLADLTQFSKSQLSNFETGKVVNPSLLFIEKLGNALEFQLSEMIYLLMQIREIMREVDEKQKGDDLVRERIEKLALAVSNIEQYFVKIRIDFSKK